MFTPQEIQEQTFSKAVFGGYDMQQVDDFLEPLTEDYIMLYKENSVLKSKMKILVEKLEEYRGQEAAMKQQMAQAQAQCDRMIAEAQSRSATIVAGAETTLRSQSDDLKKELAEMEECMPHYYKITNGHGQGAEKIMSAEAYFLQGKFTDAQIVLEQAYAQIEGNGQENIALCCDFLARRLSLCIETEERASFAARRAYLLKQHNIAWLNIFNATAAYYYALLGETEEIPEIFRTHTLFSVNILVPGKPMIEMVENQVYLAQGAYAKVIGRSEGLLAVCAGLHYALVTLHLRIQTAAAYAMLGKTEEAQTLLLQALQEAEPDEFLLPFVENYRYIKKTLEKLPQTPLLARIQRLGKASEQRQKQLSTHRPASLATLTEREYEIVKLMASRLRNREIAEKLFLSEGSVKQYINQIYSKLQIEGDTHSKRKQLFQLLEEKT